MHVETVGPQSGRFFGGLLLLLFFVGFLSSQRLLAPYASAYVCLIPFGLALVYWRIKPFRDLMLVVSLLAKVDSSDIAYMDTLNYVRFIIYFLVLVVFLGEFRIKLNVLVALVCYVGFIIVLTINNIVDVDAYTLVRDLITLALIIVVVVSQRKSVNGYIVKAVHVNYFSLGLLFGEILNLLFFFDRSLGHYLSYDSLKCIVCFSSLYYYVTGRRMIGFFLIIPTLVVLIEYATRMLVFGYLFVLLTIYFSFPGRKINVVLTGIVFLVASSFYANTENMVESSRVFGIFFIDGGSGDIFEIFRLLDPVRFVEHEMFFEQDWFHLIFGNGLGAGFIDTTGRFGFVPFDSGAFSDRELNEGRFYRLHDAWIYFGLRFGLGFVVFSYVILFREILCGNADRVLTGGLAFLMLTTATFSIAGLVMTAILIFQLKFQLDLDVSNTHLVLHDRNGT